MTDDIVTEIADTALALMRRHRPDRLHLHDGQLHLTFDLHADDGAPTADDTLRLLLLQLAVRACRIGAAAWSTPAAPPIPTTGA